jgi:hypothetical protein
VRNHDAEAIFFSLEADVVADIVITAIGVDALRNVEHPSERPLVALPLISRMPQVIEAVVWWGVEGHVTDRKTEWFTWLYLAVAFSLLPWFARTVRNRSRKSLNDLTMSPPPSSTLLRRSSTRRRSFSVLDY